MTVTCSSSLCGASFSYSERVAAAQKIFAYRMLYRVPGPNAMEGTNIIFIKRAAATFKPDA